jgi:hypothetical protein
MMTQNSLRYSPDVEKPEPDFDRTLQAILDAMKQRMRGSIEAEGIGRMVRDAHAKGYGLARAEVEILGGLPDAYAQGIYAKPGRHDAIVRFSNGTNHVGDDRYLGPIVGIGLKMFGMEGPTLLEDEPDSHTFDYALINHPVFLANTLKHYVYIQTLFAHIGVAPPANAAVGHFVPIELGVLHETGRLGRRIFHRPGNSNSSGYVPAGVTQDRGGDQ